jgi:O-antigen/teichoic acid export membrane protein
MEGGLKKHFFRNLGSRGIFIFFQAIFNLVLPIVTSPDTFGMFTIVLTNVNFAVLISSAGIPSLLSYHASKYPSSFTSLNRLLVISTIVQLLFITVAEGTSLIIRNTFFIWPSEGMVAGIAGILFFTGIASAEKLSGLYTGYLKIGRYYSIAAVILIGQLLILVLWFVNGSPGSVHIPLFVLVGGYCLLVAILYGVFHLMKNKEHTRIEHSIEWKAGWLYALPAYLATIVQFMATRVDLWLVDHWLDKTQVGFYALSNQLGQILLLLPMVLASLVFPLLVSGKLKLKQFEVGIRLMNGMLWVFLLLGYLLSPFLIPFIWNNKYNEAIYPVLWILPGFFARAQIALYATYFAAERKISMNIWTSVIGLACVLLGDLLLLPILKIQGAAIALSIAQIFSGIWIIGKYNIHAQTTGYRLWPRKEEWILLNPLSILNRLT